MSEVSKADGVPPQSDSGAISGENVSTNGKTNSAAETAADNSVDYRTYDRAVGDLKRWKSQSDEWKTKAEKYEQADLERQGKHEEVIKSLRDHNDSLKKSLQEKDAQYAWTTVTGQIKTEAAKSGCVDVDALVKLGDFKAVQVDDKYNVNGDDLTQALENARSKFNYLWGQKGPAVADIAPSSRPGGAYAGNDKNDKLDFNKMSLKQKYELLAKTSGSRN